MLHVWEGSLPSLICKKGTLFFRKAGFSCGFRLVQGSDITTLSSRNYLHSLAIGLHNQSDDAILVTPAQPVEVCVTEGYESPRSPLTHCQTCHAGWCWKQWNICPASPHSFRLRVNLLSTWENGVPASDRPVLVFCQAAQCWGEKVPQRDVRSSHHPRGLWFRQPAHEYLAGGHVVGLWLLSCSSLQLLHSLEAVLGDTAKLLLTASMGCRYCLMLPDVTRTLGKNQN